MHSNFDIHTLKKGAFYAGLVATAVAVWMTFSYGKQMTMAHGIGMGLLTMFTGVVWTFWDYYKRIGRTGLAGWLMFFGVGFTIVEYGSHIGYTVGHRVEVSETTGVMNANWQSAQDSVVEDKANLDLWRKQLAELTEQNAWAATVKAESLRSQLETAEKAIENETKRGGCKARCEAKMRERDAIAERIGKVEQVEDLTKRIEATQRILDGKRTTASTTEFKSSPIVNQNKFVAQLATMEIEPGKEALTWVQILIGAFIALVTTFLAPVCFLCAFGDAAAGIPDKREDHDVWAKQAKRNEQAANGGTVIVQKTERVDDPRWQRLAARLA